MILADTSVWIDHFRRSGGTMAQLLSESRVLMHRFVLGEIAMGSIRDRATVLAALSRLPELMPARDSEVLAFIERNRLFGTGVGYLDAHLLAAAKLVPSARLWTKDRRLHQAAEELGLAFDGG